MRGGLRAAVLAAVLGLAAGRAGAEDTLRTVAFAHGQNSATIHQGLVRGDSDIWVVIGRAGQNAEIKVKSLEDNVSFRIYQPPSKVKRSEDGIDIDGPQVSGVDPVPGLDAGAGRHWKGALPASGRYYVVLSGDRGNATYDLTVTIR